MPQFASLTPSAERSLNRAARFAIADNSVRVCANHLLWALWLEESKAASVLRSLGVSRDQIAMHVDVTFEGEEPHNPAMTTDILANARQFQHCVDSGSGELTSEHLLLGLTGLATEQLAALGITAEKIEDLLVPQIDTGALPVAVEFQFESETAEPAEPVVVWNGDGSEHRGTSNGLLQATGSELDVYRAIDAALNRAREGLRVAEDLVRFVLGDRFLTQQLKMLRHGLSEATESLDPIQLLRARDTQRDSGTTISLPTECRRENALSVLLANMKRSQEALRTLEEMTKVVSRDGAAAAQIEQTRYRSYTIEKAIATTMNANAVFTDRCLYLLVTESLCQGKWQDVVMDAIQGGVDVIQLREKSLSDSELIRRGQWLREATRRADVLFIVNDRANVAAEVGADGLHLGQGDGSVQDARRTLGGTALVGVSTHSIEEAHQAVLDGADYLGVGPVFPTNTKTFAEHPGLEYVREVAGEITLPWFAIGGLNGTNVSRVEESGAQRIAVSSAICGTAGVRQASNTLSKLLRS